MEPFPYNLPIFRRSHEATSPDGRLTASMTAVEVSMSNPTSGRLMLSDGFQVDACNPSFLWSEDSRFLAVPQWRYVLGLQVRQRLLILDTADRMVYASKPLAWFLQPESFRPGVLAILGEPTRREPLRITFEIPGDLRGFRKLNVNW